MTDPSSRSGEQAISAAVQDYLKAVYQLELVDRCTPSQLAEALGVSGAAVTRMIKRLRDLGLVLYERPHKVELTDAGRKIALEVIRHHRLLELYLTEALGYAWDEVHSEAEELEHAVSAKLASRIAHALGNPTHDPHGEPIPTVEGAVEQRALRPLNDLKDGESAVIRRVTDEDSGRLRMMARLGLFPDTPVCLLERRGFDNVLVLQVGAELQIVGTDLAAHVFVG